jgi:cytochrome c oxidase cbb3-type subunit III
MNKVGAITIAVSLTLALAAGCDREDRRLKDDPKINRLAMGGAQNADLSPGPLPRPPQPLQIESPAEPYDRNAFMVANGQTLYQWMNCVGCHASGGGGMGPALMDDEWLYGIEPNQIYISIVEGRANGMPSYRGKLTEKQVWQLVAYVRALSGQLPKDVSPSRSDHMGVKVPEAEKERESPTQQQPGAEKNEEQR